MNNSKPTQRESLQLTTRLSIYIGIFLLLLLSSVFFVYSHQELDEVEEYTREKVERVLLAVQAIHTQSMIFRGDLDDDNSVVKVLDSTLQTLSEVEKNMAVWLVMGPKVLAYQTERGNEREPPKDAVDRAGINKKRIIWELTDNSIFRLSIPIILGQGIANNPRCFSCHETKMGLQADDVIGLFSASYDASIDFSNAYSKITKSALLLLGILASFVAVIFYIIKNICWQSS
jgi:methyl-accepting chemotaxis protein